MMFVWLWQSKDIDSPIETSCADHTTIKHPQHHSFSKWTLADQFCKEEPPLSEQKLRTFDGHSRRTACTYLHSHRHWAVGNGIYHIRGDCCMSTNP